jgi:uncharacterized protein (TIGR02145 family)
MNKIKILSVCLLFASSLIISSCSGELKDHDGNNFKAVKIGDQIWMAENLNVSHFRNGDTIPEARSAEDWVRLGRESKPAWCYMENDPENGKKFGKLYNWYAGTDPRGLAPDGWHVATDDEWTRLINYLGGGVLAALKMRTTGLMENGKNDQASFSGIPAGCRNNYGNFYGMDSFAYWWSATEGDSSNAWMRIMNIVKCDINTQNFNKSYGTSVRCLKN